MSINISSIVSDLGSAPDKACTVRLALDTRITNYLLPGHCNKYSRAEAFVDIIHRIQENVTVQAKSRGKPDSSDAGSKETALRVISQANIEQCVETNCSQLADSWHWNRITVSKFLAELEQLGILLCVKHGHKLVIYI